MNRHLLALAAAVALVSVAPSQPPADHTPSTKRKFTLPVQFDPEKRKTIQQLQLLVSRDQGQTWAVEDAITPDKEHLNFDAKDDGVYWLAMMIRHKDGTSDPPELKSLTADRVLKYLIDATPPAVRLTTARRDGDEVVLEWSVEDKHPNDPATAVSYKAGGDWQPVPADAVSKRTARFRPANPGPVSVRVSVQDAAGNPGVVIKELPGGAGTSAGYTPAVVTAAAANQAGGLGTPQLPTPVLPSTSPPVLPSVGPSAPSGPIMPVTPVPAPAAPVVTTPVAPAPLPPPAPALPTTPASTPPVTAAPAWSTPPAADVGPPPLAVSGGVAPAFAPAAVPTAPEPTGPVQHIRFTQFQLQYQLDAGPSGVKQIDLYVTRDDGRSWTRWSQHDGKENPLRVNLQPRSGGSADGDYGFKLVSLSGANLSDDLPTPGTPPDVRVRVDTTPPLVSIWPIAADPVNRGAVLIKWKAEDANLSEASAIGIDWSASPTGPWTPVGGTEPGSLNPSAAGRVPNRGTYSWQLPPNLPGHLLYFRFTAQDPAGNRSEVIAPPQTVDLVRPRARIQSVVTTAVGR